MKKILNIAAVVLAVMTLVAMTVPVMASDHETEVSVIGLNGGGNPIIKCKWETPDDDTGAGKGGTQVDPPLAWEANKTVTYWAIVTDPEGKDNIAAVYVDVWHPPGMPNCGSFKYQLQLVKLTAAQKDTIGIPAFEQAWADGTIDSECIGTNLDTSLPYTYDDIMFELSECAVDVYKVEGELYYEQPAGDYEVQILAVDKQANETTLTNHMTYVATAAIEVDFTTFNFGPISICDNKQVDGDRTFGPVGPAGVGTDNGATVRNIGNTLAKVTVYETDLYQMTDATPPVKIDPPVALGMTGGLWNVVYDARLGDATHTQVVFNPETTRTLPDILELSTVEKLDFSIHVKKYGTEGTWTGDMTIGCVWTAFTGTCGD